MRLARSLIFLCIFCITLLPIVAAEAVGQGSQGNVLGRVTISTTIEASPTYDFYGGGVTQVQVDLNGTQLKISNVQKGELIGSFRPSSVQASVVVGSATRLLAVTVTGGRFGTFYSYDFTLPVNSTSFFFSIRGSVSGSSFLWRYITGVPAIGFNGWNGAVFPLETRLTMPTGNEVHNVYDGYGNPLPSNDVSPTGTSNGLASYQVASGVTTIIIESQLFTPAAIVVTVVSAFVLFLASLGYFGQGRVLVDRLAVIQRKYVPRQTLGNFNFRALFRPKTILILFLLCAFFMAAIGVTAGPDPRVKAYVVSDASNTNAIQASLSEISPNIAVVTPAQDYSDFATMSSVGEFNLIVVSNYPSLALPSVSQYVLGSLGNVPIIVIDRSADQNFAKQIATLYPTRIVPVQNAASLNQTELQTIGSLLSSTVRTNVLGLHLGVTQFKLILGFEGVLSFVLIFLGWTYMGSLITDSSSQADWTYLASVISAGVFVFVFSEVTYVQVSSLLAFPLSLHAVISGAKDVTAVGLLGFGGGSTPRLAAGFLGVLVGIFAAETRPPLHRADFAVLIAIPLILLANPFFVGSFAYESVLLFVGNYAFGTAFTTSLSFKGFIYGVGSALGGGVSPTYLLSAGKMLYFAGFPLLAYLRRLGRTTLALGVLGCAFLIGDGGVRVGEMTPTKTFVAILPGLFTGFAIAGLFLGLAMIEKYVRGMGR